MLISTDWIKDFVKLPEDLTPKQLGERFTLATAEVEDVLTEGECFDKIHVAEILEFEKHPDADKLNLVTFNMGKETRRVVCGASNVKVGLKTPYAPIGVTLPNGFTLEPKKIRGVLSEGMLCSEEELGFADESAGIMELPADAPVGQTLKDYMSIPQDVLLDVDNKSLTHRPDLWGHFGIAREFATIFNEDLNNRFDKAWDEGLRSKIPGGDSPVKVKVDAESSCLAYYGLSLEGVTVKESPEWMKRRLLAVGLRPINNIVDISNYVMTELGIPLHIFDRDQIKGGQVHINKLSSEEAFITLDEVERALIAGDTVISDNERPLVVAGIMGGLNSGVVDSTDKIFIEVANWKAAEVRRTSTRLGLRTDSSQRYEKTLDSKLCERTMLRTLELVLELCPEAKVVGSLEYDGTDLTQIETLKIETSAASISRTLGKEVSTEEVTRILSSLDFLVEPQGEKLMVNVPSYRSTKDIEFEADLVEEIGRMIGYDNIDPVSPQVSISPVRLTPARELHRKIRDFMIFHGKSLEVMTYPMVGEKLLKKADWKDEENLVLLNSLSRDQDRMRCSLIPNFLEVAALNQKNHDQFKFFELGRTYSKGQKTFAEEESTLGIAFYHKTKSCFMELSNTVERLLGATNIPGDLCDRHPKFKNPLVPEEWTGNHPFEFQNIRIMGKMHGAIFTVHPLLLRSFKIKGHLSFAFINLNAVEARPLKSKLKYNPLPKFPSSTFDWTVVADKDSAIGDIMGALKKVKMKELVSCKVADVFTLNETQKTVTLRATFSDPEKTLDGDFLGKAKDQLVEALDKAGYPLKS